VSPQACTTWTARAPASPAPPSRWVRVPPTPTGSSTAPCGRGCPPRPPAPWRAAPSTRRRAGTPTRGAGWPCTTWGPGGGAACPATTWPSCRGATGTNHAAAGGTGRRGRRPPGNKRRWNGPQVSSGA
ncbi:proteasome subunit beta type-5-like, partial [Columba livia]